MFGNCLRHQSFNDSPSLYFHGGSDLQEKGLYTQEKGRDRDQVMGERTAEGGRTRTG